MVRTKARHCAPGNPHRSDEMRAAAARISPALDSGFNVDEPSDPDLPQHPLPSSVRG